MHEEYFTGYDSSYKLIFHAAWADYEEDGWIFIFTKENKYYSLEGGYCLMAEKHCSQYSWNDLQEISEEEALQEMIDWEDCEYPE